MSDSQLVVYQLTGVYAIKSPAIVELADRVFELIKRLGCPADFKWILCEENKFANALASKAAGMPVARIINYYTELDEWKPDLYFTPNEHELKKLPPVNSTCKHGIERLLVLDSRAKFKDYAALRTGGLDEYSKVDTETLKKIHNYQAWT